MDLFPFNYTSGAGEKVRGIGGRVHTLQTCWLPLLINTSEDGEVPYCTVAQVPEDGEETETAAAEGAGRGVRKECYKECTIISACN